MEKKDLIKFINRIPDTGPRGTDDIKKVLKMLVEGLGNNSDKDTPSDGSSTPSSGGCSCLAPMIVEGTIDWSGGTFAPFTPNEGQPTLAEATAHYAAGGLVYMRTFDVNDETVYNIMATYMEGNELSGKAEDTAVYWAGFDEDEEDNGGSSGGNDGPIG